MFDRKDVERIWNAMVDRQVRVKTVAEQFYWKWPNEESQ